MAHQDQNRDASKDVVGQRTLIVVPKNVFMHWKQVLSKELGVRKLDGDDDEDAHHILSYSLEYCGNRRFQKVKNIKDPNQIRVVLTTPGTVLSDFDGHREESLLFANPSDSDSQFQSWMKRHTYEKKMVDENDDRDPAVIFDRLVIDEIHKTLGDATRKALIDLGKHIPLRWMMTATPYENSIEVLQWMAMFIDAAKPNGHFGYMLEPKLESDVVDYRPCCFNCGDPLKRGSDAWEKRFMRDLRKRDQWYFCSKRECKQYRGRPLKNIEPEETRKKIEANKEREHKTYEDALRKLKSIRTWMKHFMMRRTYKNVKSELEQEIGRLKIHYEQVKFHPEEQAVYDKARPEIKESDVTSFNKHFEHATNDAIKTGNHITLLETMSLLSIRSTQSRKVGKYWFGSKIERTVEIAQSILDNTDVPGQGPGMKLVVFSKYLKNLMDLKVFFEENSLLSHDGEFCWLETIMFHGSMTLAERDAALEQFRRSDGKPKVLLVTVQCGYGLDFSTASNVIFLQPHFNPFVLQQAWCRVYRFGQKHEVNVWILQATGTIEDYMQKIAEVKIEAAKLYMTQAVFPTSLGREYPQCDESDDKIIHNKFVTLYDVKLLIRHGFLTKIVNLEEAQKQVKEFHQRKRKRAVAKNSRKSPKHRHSKHGKRQDSKKLERNPDGTLKLPCKLPKYRAEKSRVVYCLGDGPLIKVHRADYYVRPGFKSVIIMKGIKFLNSIHPPVRDDSDFPIFKVMYKKPNGDSGVISNEKAELMGKEAILKKYGPAPKKKNATTAEILAYNKRLWNDGIFRTPALVTNAAFTLHNGWSTGAQIATNAWFGYEPVQGDIMKEQ